MSQTDELRKALEALVEDLRERARRCSDRAAASEANAYLNSAASLETTIAAHAPEPAEGTYREYYEARLAYFDKYGMQSAYDTPEWRRIEDAEEAIVALRAQKEMT